MNTQVTASLQREHWKSLHGRQRAQYIWDYYKLPAAICLIALYIIGYTVHGHFSQKETLLYTGLVNVSAGDQLGKDLSSGFVGSLDADVSQKDLKLYSGLYLTDDPKDPNHEYAYASRMKILASIDDEKLDVVLMNKEAFDAFSQNGYLYNMEELLHRIDSDIAAGLKPYLVTNMVILKDNADDMALDRSLTYQAVTEEYPMGLQVSQTGPFKKAGLDGEVYLGVVKNTPRIDRVLEYIEYLSRL